ncbi:MAG: hypothetical protein K2W96_04545 [Gemmataceae bacterium]|nr:hypothetical protein [Gemmataceae bacterium]
MTDIIREIRKVRDAFARRHNYDLESMVRELREHQEARGKEIVTLIPPSSDSAPPVAGAAKAVAVHAS